MSLVSIVLTSVGLGMDAFAVSICKGLSIKNYSIYKSIIKDIYDIIVKGDENGKEYTKQFVRDKITEIAKSNILEIINIKFTSANIVKLYTPEEKLLAIDTLKAMLPILQEYETWYEKVTRVLGDTSKYSKEDLKKVLAALEQ